MIVHRLVVVADAHLSAASGDDEAAFHALLDALPAYGDALLLAGDSYDFWFTYKQLIPRDCVRVTAQIIELARRMPVFMLGGNHDRWGDTFWGPQTDVRFDRRRLRIDVGGRAVLALHGDGLHEERRRAAVLNRLLDAPAVHTLFDALPPAIGFHLARRLSHKPEFAAAHPEVVAAAAARQLAWATQALAADPSIDALVMGHTHRAALEEITPGRWYINPGAWLGERRFATIDASHIELRVFR